MNEHTGKHGRGRKLFEYVNATGEGVVQSRRDYADFFGVSYGTALYHLERAVKLGYLNKQIGWVTDRQSGWLYGLPETLPRLEGM